MQSAGESRSIARERLGNYKPLAQIFAALYMPLLQISNAIDGHHYYFSPELFFPVSVATMATVVDPRTGVHSLSPLYLFDSNEKSVILAHNARWGSVTALTSLGVASELRWELSRLGLRGRLLLL